MRRPDNHFDAELWESVQFTRPAVRARATLILYTGLASLPFIALSVCGAYLCGLLTHEIIGIACYHAMLTSVFIFDSLRSAAHTCFNEACDAGLVSVRNGIPVVGPGYRHRRLARLAFAIGGHNP